MAPDVGIIEAAEILGVSQKHAQRLALDVDPHDPVAVRAAFSARRLPGRKISRVWIFRRTDVEKFARLDRPVGRPRRSKRAA